MTVRFTARRMAWQGKTHDEISALRWVEDGTTDEYESTRDVLVAWVRDGGRGYALDEAGEQQWIELVEGDPPHVRTRGEGEWRDDLLKLPLY